MCYKQIVGVTTKFLFLQDVSCFVTTTVVVSPLFKYFSDVNGELCYLKSSTKSMPVEKEIYQLKQGVLAYFLP